MANGDKKTKDIESVKTKEGISEDKFRESEIVNPENNSSEQFEQKPSAIPLKSIEDLQRDKLEWEITKLQADKTKADLEIKDLKRPPFFRSAFITVLGPALLSLFGAMMVLYLGSYGPQISKLENANKEIANKEAKITDLNGQIENVSNIKEDAIQKLSDLDDQIKFFEATSEKEKKEKENYESINKNLKAQQSALENRLTSLNTQKEKDQAVIDQLRFDYVKFNTEIAKQKEELKTAVYNAKVARLEVPLSQLLTISQENEGLKDNEEVAEDGFKIGATTITKTFNAYSQYEEEYNDFFKKALQNENYSLRQKLRIAVLMFKLTNREEWQNKSHILIQEVINKAVNEFDYNLLKGEIEEVKFIDERQITYILDVLENKTKDLSDIETFNFF
ncbi:MAG TPA: hypothetical protein VF571_16240, partial [Pyrinomonadaceae bacterium]